MSEVDIGAGDRWGQEVVRELSPVTSELFA